MLEVATYYHQPLTTIKAISSNLSPPSSPHGAQIHSATLESGVLENEEILLELERVKRELGWHIGLSVSGVQQGEVIRLAMARRTADGRPLFDSVQATWNVLEQSAGERMTVGGSLTARLLQKPIPASCLRSSPLALSPRSDLRLPLPLFLAGVALAEASRAGMDVIVKEGMANGRVLQGKYFATLQAAAERHGSSPDAVALAVAMLQPFQPMVLSGAASVEHLQSNARALKLVQELSQEEVDEILGALRQEPSEYWAERSALAWN
jgi:aryl-alcohol dehydrogenase-like predicted oxidoreductase